MPTDVHWQRALLLANQNRADLAVDELRQLLAADPDHAPAHALLAQLLALRDDLDEALQEAQRAIGLAPALPFAHHTHGSVLWRRGDGAAAAAAVQRAIELDPEEPDHHAMLAQVRLSQKRWDDAARAAAAALELDPQHVDALNLRSMALVRLGRKGEADDALDASLARDPDNPYTHQARGFALLHRGDAHGALRHFQEALRRDPTLDGARHGLVEALKARNPVYRLLLGFLLWLERFSAGRQQQILIGAWLVVFVARRVLAGTGHGEAAAVVGLGWLAVVLFTACTVPVFNLLLLLHPLGRHALDRQARNDSILLGVALVVLAGVAVHRVVAPAPWSVLGVWFWLVFLLPVAGLGLFAAGWARRALQAFCVAMPIWFVVWAVRLQQLAADATATVQRAEAHVDQLWSMVLATALSSWFVLLAPKGSRRRRAQGRR